MQGNSFKIMIKYDKLQKVLKIIQKYAKVCNNIQWYAKVPGNTGIVLGKYRESTRKELEIQQEITEKSTCKYKENTIKHCECTRKLIQKNNGESTKKVPEKYGERTKKEPVNLHKK